MIVKTEQIPEGINSTVVSDEPSVELIKVLHIINGEHFAGAERVQDLLAMALPEFGFAADFACLKLDKFGDVRQSQTQIHALTMNNAYDLKPVRQLIQIVKQNNYEIIHAHTPRTLMIGALANRWLHLPLVYHVHSPVGRDSTRKLRNWINTQVERWCLRSVDAMVCVSNSLSEYMRGLGHEASKLHVVCNGVPACFNLPEKQPPSQSLTLGTMALFRPRKGIESLLEALALIRQQKVDVHLRAVGSFETPEYQREVSQYADQLGVSDCITWTGFQSDINEQLQLMDLFVLPSLFGEGLPMVVLESMAVGIPVIASNVEGIPEAVRDGIDGLIFKPGSAADLAEKVISMNGHTDRWKEFRSNALSRQRECLSDISMARGIAAIYRQIMPHA